MNEINVGKGGICVVSYERRPEEFRQGRAFLGRNGAILDNALNEVGLSRSQVNILMGDARAELAALQPSVTIAFGAQSAHLLIPDWPDGRDRNGLTHRGNITKAMDLENRRGYVFDSPYGPVVPTMHPDFVAKTWTPWRVLLSHDIQKARGIHKDGLVRPSRNVEIVSSDSDARRALSDLRRFRVLGADIETWGDTSLACIGFAGESGKAYVFPAQYLNRASELLRDPDLTTVWANGIYDLFVLRHREGVDFRARVEDAQLAWHACYPELAGQKESKRKHRFTRKSLAFLASLATTDYWWKGDYSTEEEFFIYNGKDCCITLDVWHHVVGEMEHVGAGETYEHERGLMWPCVDMLARGLRVDEALRLERVEALTADIVSVERDALQTVAPLLEQQAPVLEALGRLDLFREVDPVCECCGHGKKKQHSCWACAGFAKSPNKKDMEGKWGKELTKGKSKKELEGLLPVCHVCGGAPRETRWSFNANSDTQMKILLYDVLKLPKRFKRNVKGKSVLTVDEQALKGLLGGLPNEESY